MKTKPDTSQCSDCHASVATGGSPNRRAFLQSAGCIGTVVALFGVTSTEAWGLPVSVIAAEQSGDERRYPVPATDAVNIDHAAQLIVVRFQGHVFVFSLSCPHQNNAVKWMPNDHRFQCTKHDSQYQPDGVHTAGRATRNLDRYVIRREGDTLVVDLHRWIQSDKDPAAWAAAALVV